LAAAEYFAADVVGEPRHEYDDHNPHRGEDD
jgi:hypothetical protein